MLEGRAVVRETDMTEAMRSHVMDLAYQALDLHESSDCQAIAHHIKQVIDSPSYVPSKILCLTELIFWCRHVAPLSVEIRLLSCFQEQ